MVRHPWLTILAWVVAAVAVIATSPGLPTTTNESSFLPKSYESIRAANLQDKAFPQAGHVAASAAIIVFSRADGGKLTPADSAKVRSVAASLGARHIHNIVGVTAGPPSPNREVQTALVANVVAPWYLLASVVLGFGASVLVFQGFGGQTGLAFLLPVYMYLFVVAFGTDYNILMIARLREQAKEGMPPRQAASVAFRHAAPTIAAAGLILAGTFASLTLAGNTILAQLGFAVACGIALAAFVMAMFFSPSLTALIGRMAWWPGHAAERQAPAGQPTQEAAH